MRTTKLEIKNGIEGIINGSPIASPVAVIITPLMIDRLVIYIKNIESKAYGDGYQDRKDEHKWDNVR